MEYESPISHGSLVMIMDNDVNNDDARSMTTVCWTFFRQAKKEGSSTSFRYLNSST